MTKLRDTHRAESNMYMKAVRATLILVPLLGIQFVIFPWRPENRLAGEVYEYIMHILMHYQVGTDRKQVIMQKFHIKCQVPGFACLAMKDNEMRHNYLYALKLFLSVFFEFNN